MKPILKLFALALGLCQVTSCATSSKEAVQNAGPTATYQVCRYNHDLACVNVRVKGNSAS